MNMNICLKKFQRKLSIPNSGDELLFMGVLAYRGTGATTRSLKTINKTSGGHYLTYAYRRGNTSWMELDDIPASCKFVRDSAKVIPRLLMYIKTRH